FTLLLFFVCFPFSFYESADPRDLLSFPTRRSSDLRWRLRVCHRSRERPRRRLCLDAALARLTPRSFGGDGGNARHPRAERARSQDRKSTRLNSSHVKISYAVFCLKKKKKLIECMRT